MTRDYSVSQVLADADGNVAMTVRRPMRPEEIAWVDLRYELSRPEVRDHEEVTATIDLRGLGDSNRGQILQHLVRELRADTQLWIGTKWRRVFIRLDPASVTISVSATELM